MTRSTVSIATLYSSAQCVLSVVGSVGVILLFAGIPQLIYSPVVSVANLMTFILGAVLITTMVIGNSFLNYKYRSFSRSSSRDSERGSRTLQHPRPRSDIDDKPPSYDAILTSDGLPPDYFSVFSEKPPRYEDITAGGIFTIESASTSASCSDAFTDTSTSPPVRQNLQTSTHVNNNVPVHVLKLKHSTTKVLVSSNTKNTVEVIVEEEEEEEEDGNTDAKSTSESVRNQESETNNTTERSGSGSHTYEYTLDTGSNESES